MQFIKLARQPLVHLQVLLALALLLGGGGVVYGWRHMVIELAALAVLAMNPASIRTFLSARTGLLVPLVLLTVILPLLQTLPLPSSVWHTLPGRELVTEAYAATGLSADRWFSFSLDPMRTLVAFCATLVPLTIIVVGNSLDQQDRTKLAWTLAILGGVALVLGAVQLTSGNTLAMVTDTNPDPDVFYSLFSNRNSTGMFFVVIGMVLVALPWSRVVMGPALTAASLPLALLAVFLTQSRTAISLAALVVLFAGVRLFAEWRRKRPMAAGATGGRALPAILAIVVVAGFGAAAFLAATMPGRLSEAAQRFSVIEQDRIEMWDDSAYVAGRYWPFGAGTGAFDDVFQVDESLEYVSLARAGRAHNDYLELAIEVGIPGLLILAAWWLWIGFAAWRRMRDPDPWLALAALLAFVAIALQSLLDYPLRNHAMLAVAGLLVVLLLPPRERQGTAA